MVRGMPLKEIHFNPTSRISSAVASFGFAMFEGADEDATLCRAESDSGELRVNVAADCQY